MPTVYLIYLQPYLFVNPIYIFFISITLTSLEGLGNIRATVPPDLDSNLSSLQFDLLQRR